MSASSSKPQPPPPRHLHLHVDTTSATAAATTTNGSPASPGSASSSHHSSSAPRPATPTGRGGGSEGTQNSWSGACAACKYQRRKCNRNCPLAPYFPGDQQSRFIRAQRLFGVSNMLKTLKRVGPKYGLDAMRTIIYQSEARAADPVGGCVSIIQELRRQIRDSEMELQFVRQQIAICHQQAAATDSGLSADPAAMILPAASSPVVGLVAAGQQDDMVTVDAIYAASQQPSIQAGDLRNNDPSSHQQQLYDYFCYNNGTAGTSDDGGMQQYGLADVVDSSVAKAGSPAVALGEQLGQHCQIQASPFVDAFNEKKPQVLPATIQHHRPAAAAGDVLHPQQKKLATSVLVKHDDDLDEHMEEQQATTEAPCHLELGFSTF
ncbi:unnamed protein product [Miscanthus lutarioriparius]|uniref:LOB domain-containing protein n=1 Tax=Miscanthus lutarioriparius TaxID=422564 RepID=A0A811N1V3_9POAL|nr:unnamed protein product [Miscanthus lutarioriparius]